MMDTSFLLLFVLNRPVIYYCRSEYNNMLNMLHSYLTITFELNFLHGVTD